MWFDAAVTDSLRRDRLADGEETTIYFRQPRRLDWWCAKNQVDSEQDQPAPASRPIVTALML